MRRPKTAPPIPNKELMDKFAEMAQKEASLGAVYQLAKESGRMLAATRAGDTKTMAEEAISQMKSRQYAIRFERMLRERPEYTGRILAVGIAYQKEDERKRHQCKVEVLRERLS